MPAWPDERKIDPDFPGQEFTWAEIDKYYKSKFQKHEIADYWNRVCYLPKKSAKVKENGTKPEKKTKEDKKPREPKKPKEPKEPKSGRFIDPWFRKFDRVTSGYRDSAGFVMRLPLRLESSEIMVHGTVDAKKMWSEYDNEAFHPILVDGKAVVSVWFNNFKDTDCGGAYFESWYNTFVTPKDTPQVELPADAGPMGAIAHEKALIFLQRVICGDHPENPGAAMKAIIGGRECFGFPKHPELAEITLHYEEDEATKGLNQQFKFNFKAKHSGKDAVTLSVRLPEADEGYTTIPIDAKTAPDGVIGAPVNGGTHKGHNGAFQGRFGQAFKCTQHLKPWDAKTDSLTFGNDDHYATPIKRWGFTPILKVHSPDFKIAAFKPHGWISGNEAAKAIREHEAKIADGVKAGAL